MGWFLNLIRPKIRTRKTLNIPADLWRNCPNCGEMVYVQQLEQALYVCPKCSYHERIGAKIRIEQLADSAPEYLNLPALEDDPIIFQDSKSYKDRLKEVRKKLDCDCLVAEITIHSEPVVVFAMDFGFIGGSMGSFVGTAFLKAAQLAIQKNKPLIAICTSGGARMQEGIISLMQMPKTVLACEMMAQKRVPYITVLSDPTTGGVVASFAMLGDVTLAEPNALIGFTGPRVIEETMHIKLPSEFQRAEFQLKHGFVDEIVHRSKLKEKLARIVRILTHKQKSIGNSEH